MSYLAWLAAWLSASLPGAQCQGIDIIPITDTPTSNVQIVALRTPACRFKVAISNGGSRDQRIPTIVAEPGHGRAYREMSLIVYEPNLVLSRPDRIEVSLPNGSGGSERLWLLFAPAKAAAGRA